MKASQAGVVRLGIFDGQKDYQSKPLQTNKEEEFTLTIPIKMRRLSQFKVNVFPRDDNIIYVQILEFEIMQANVKL